MRTTRWLAVTLLGCCLTGIALAQAPPAKPGPEHEKLGYFVGNWAGEGSVNPSPFGPGGKMTSTDRCEWFEGKFSVVCHSSGSGPTGPMKSIGILGYSTDQKVYTYYGTGNDGMTMMSIPRGTVQGDTWTYDDESEMGGKKVKSRYVMKVLSPTSYTYKWEMLGPDGKWMPVMEGKQTKK